MAAARARLDAEGAFGTERVAIDLIETASSCQRVPADLATGHDDTHWALLPDGSGLRRVPKMG